MASLGPIQPILSVVKTLESFVQVNLGLPDIASIMQNPNAEQAVEQVREAITTLKQVLKTLPG
jgi:hypothetical protein